MNPAMNRLLFWISMLNPRPDSFGFQYQPLSGRMARAWLEASTSASAKPRNLTMPMEPSDRHEWPDGSGYSARFLKAIAMRTSTDAAEALSLNESLSGGDPDDRLEAAPEHPLAIEGH